VHKCETDPRVAERREAATLVESANASFSQVRGGRCRCACWTLICKACCW
jgi:hypothetical protein